MLQNNGGCGHKGRGGEFRQCVRIEQFWLKFLASLNSGEKDSGTVEKPREWEMEN